jgi:hypothetical protein
MISIAGIKLEVIKFLQSYFAEGRFYSPVNNEVRFKFDYDDDKTDILIQDKNAVNDSQIGSMPIIVVARGPIRPMRTSFSYNVESHDYVTGTTNYLDGVTVPMMIHCISRNDEEAESLSMIIAPAIWMWNDKINVDGIYAIEMVGIGEPQLLEIERETDKIAVYDVVVAINMYLNYGFRRGSKQAIIYRDNEVHVTVNGENPEPPHPPIPPTPVPDMILGMSWGEVYEGADPVELGIVISNEGDTFLNVASISISSGFSLHMTPPFQVPAGESVEVPVTLDDTTLGVKLGGATITTNAGIEFFPFMAEVVEVPSPVPAPILTLGHDVGDVIVGSDAVPIGIVIANTGNALLTIGASTITTGFSINSLPPASLAAGATASFEIQLDDTTLGTKTGELTVQSNAGPVVFPLAAEVIAVPLAPTLRLGYPFASVVQNAPAPSISIIISNPGTALLTISSVTAPSGFTASAVPASVAVGGTGTFVLTLNSTATIGTFTGTVIVNSNAGNLSADVSAEVTADSRLTRIPLYFAPGVALSTNSILPSTVYQYLKPDGTYVRANIINYTAATGVEEEIVYIVMDAGKTVADITNFSIYTPVRVNASDLVHLRPTNNLLLFNTLLEGDIADMGGAVETVVTRIYLDPVSSSNLAPRGDVSSWPALKAVQVHLYDCNTIHGVLRFIPNALTSSVRFASTGYGCNGFSAAEISQTLVNWDACNSATFARDFIAHLVKRSQLTAAGEAAVVSLLAKGCTFTFKAE